MLKYFYLAFNQKRVESPNDHGVLTVYVKSRPAVYGENRIGEGSGKNDYAFDGNFNRHEWSEC